jgi:hypothetical protein
MRVLRSSAFPKLHAEPMTTVVRDEDVRDTLESMRAQLLELQPEVFKTFDLFEMPDGSIEQATFKALERMDKEREKDQAVLFFWVADHMFNAVSSKGAVISPNTAPLTVEQIAEALEQIARHPRYVEQFVSQLSEDGRTVKLVKGEVKT